MKKCLKCGDNKPLDQYCVSKRSPDGLHAYCNTCNNLRAAKYRKEHGEHVRERDRTQYHKNTEKFKQKMHTFYQHKRLTDPSYVLWKNAKARAKRMCLDFNIEKDDVVIPTHCPVLGIPFSFTNKRGFCSDSPTLDRIIPSRGYVKGNVVVISWRANIIKRDASVEELEKIYSFFKALLLSK